MIGWYVHAHGRGHLQRMQCIAAHLRSPVTVLSSLDVPGGVRLPDDLPRGDDADVTAGGVLHWAPRHHPGLRDRMAAIAGWVSHASPSLVVVDVSVEVALLVRSLGVPVVVAAMRGDRTDRPHALAYDLADALLAPWPASLPEDWPAPWLAKTWHVGALSRADGRTVVPRSGERRVAVLSGGGGSALTPVDLASAAAATPDWTWDVVGPPGPWVDDPWQALQAADVVVTHAGQNALAEVAASRRPAVVVPQERPHGEQVANARALKDLGPALVSSGWPAADAWPALLERARSRDGEGWAAWSDGHGARRAAARLDALAGA